MKGLSRVSLGLIFIRLVTIRLIAAGFRAAVLAAGLTMVVNPPEN